MQLILQLYGMLKWLWGGGRGGRQTK